MMRKLLPLIFLLMLLIASCNDDIADTSVYLISVANSYSGSNTLEATLPDQSAMIAEIAYLADKAGNSYYEYTFTQSGDSLMMDGESYGAEDVLTFLSSLESSDDDLVIFFYAGHGGAEDENGKGAVLYFDPVISNTQIYTDDLLEALSEVAGKKWLVLDCCYSGEAVTSSDLFSHMEFSVSNGKTVLSSESGIEAIKDAFSSSAGSVEGNDDIWVMAACQDTQLSYESGKYTHGFFTAGLVSALGYDLEEEEAGRSSESKLTFYSVFSEAVKIVDELISEEYGSSVSSWETPQATLTPVDLILFEF